jgi:hypothetical protein
MVRLREQWRKLRLWFRGALLGPTDPDVDDLIASRRRVSTELV